MNCDSASAQARCQARTPGSYLSIFCPPRSEIETRTREALQGGAVTTLPAGAAEEDDDAFPMEEEEEEQGPVTDGANLTPTTTAAL